MLHRVAHYLWKLRIPFLPRLISLFNRFITNIDIHPGATIGKGLVIDHGSGVVIGETAVIGNDCLIYHQVTLGGTGKNKHGEKRHPTLCNNVVIGSGARILGPITLHDRVRVGAGAVVLNDVEEGCTVVGIPARVVRWRKEGKEEEERVKMEREEEGKSGCFDNMYLNEEAGFDSSSSSSSSSSSNLQLTLDNPQDENNNHNSSSSSVSSDSSTLILTDTNNNNNNNNNNNINIISSLSLHSPSLLSFLPCSYISPFCIIYSPLSDPQHFFQTHNKNILSQQNNLRVNSTDEVTSSTLTYYYYYYYYVPLSSSSQPQLLLSLLSSSLPSFQISSLSLLPFNYKPLPHSSYQDFPSSSSSNNNNNSFSLNSSFSHSHLTKHVYS